MSTHRLSARAVGAEAHARSGDGQPDLPDLTGAPPGRCPVHATAGADALPAGARPPALLVSALGLAVSTAAAVALGLGQGVPGSPADTVTVAGVLSLAILCFAFGLRHLGAASRGRRVRLEDPVPDAGVPTFRDPVRRTQPELPPGRTGSEVDRDEAREFLELFHAENPQAGPAAPRIAEVMREIDLTGTYWHTPGELAFGARVAWRNNARCIGRLYWRSLQVRDRRAVTDAAGVAAQCFEHLRSAGNGGRIRPMITIFAPETPTRPAPRIWNEQLIRYAGYEQPDGSVLGDPRYKDFTGSLVRSGWRPPAFRGAFDVLPLVVETADEGPRMFELPRDVVHEVPFSHPELDWFADLGMRWHAVPVISNNRLEIGGVSYPCAPFNGWYMGTEIGARNLGDGDRYDLVPTVAERMGLDTSDEATLWRDQALVEINRAVLHSFRAHQVTIADHHTESRRFLTHLEREERAGRRCPADWSWIVPPLSGSQTPVFHRYYDEGDLRPNFFSDDETVSRALTGSPPAFR